MVPNRTIELEMAAAFFEFAVKLLLKSPAPIWTMPIRGDLTMIFLFLLWILASTLKLSKVFVRFPHL
jgi:hypothetical protein